MPIQQNMKQKTGRSGTRSYVGLINISFKCETATLAHVILPRPTKYTTIQEHTVPYFRKIGDYAPGLALLPQYQRNLLT